MLLTTLRLNLRDLKLHHSPETVENTANFVSTAAKLASTGLKSGTAQTLETAADINLQHSRSYRVLAEISQKSFNLESTRDFIVC